MDVKQAIENRRAFRSLDPVEITDVLIDDLATSAHLFCSCFNNQPWRYVFVHDPAMLKQLHNALSKGNEWACDASMIIAVFSKKEFDCLIKNREYFLFDTGMATAALILRATELGLVAHPIAGFDEKKAKETLNIPPDMTLITLVMVGKHSESVKAVLSDKQKEAEQARPERMPFSKSIFINSYKEQ